MIKGIKVQARPYSLSAKYLRLRSCITHLYKNLHLQPIVISFAKIRSYFELNKNAFDLRIVTNNFKNIFILNEKIFQLNIFDYVKTPSQKLNKYLMWRILNDFVDASC